ncbi:MAG: flagellar assembly protein FliW [Bacillota bacterium]|jgi:flagellar assembly factor FliW|nr:flagellar assembly protein FliW [Bacillota bacterium]
MELETRLGTIEVNEDEIIDFPVGILGFSEYHRYVIIEQEGSAFSFLQSVDNKDLCFVIIMPELVCCDYAVELSDDQIELLQIESPEDGKVYGIVTIPENVAEMTVNLQAPVVINTKSLIGAQFVLPGDQYHTKHNVIAEMHKNAYLLQKQSEAVQAQTDRENLQESV